jgi:DNA-directed RNA polymerase subunit L
MKKPDIKISVKEYIKSSGFTASRLTLKMEGKDMNTIIANTIRRVSMEDIPMYAFAYINIEHNDSVFNNSMMRVHLEQLPIYDIECGLHYLHPSFWKNVDYNDKNRQKHEREIIIDGVINAYNNTTDIMNVTTDNMEYYVEGEKKEYPKRNKDAPILLIQLRPQETFKCVMKGCLGVGENNNMWSASHTYYDEIDENKIELTLESMGQMSEYDILIKSCKLINMKLDNIKHEIKKRVADKTIKNDQTLILELENEDHTIGNLINNLLQEHANIIFAGLSKPNHLVKMIRFKIHGANNESPLKALYEVIDFLMEVYNTIESNIQKMKPEAKPEVKTEVNKSKSRKGKISID